MALILYKAGPSKSSNERQKSMMKIATQVVTTAAVAEAPTSFAPPLVVSPQLQPITATTMPKMNALSSTIKISA